MYCIFHTFVCCNYVVGPFDSTAAKPLPTFKIKSCIDLALLYQSYLYDSVGFTARTYFSKRATLASMCADMLREAVPPMKKTFLFVLIFFVF